MREVELAASLSHPNIAQIYDSGYSDGVPWLAMELVDGVDLAAWVCHHQLDEQSKLHLMANVCDAVAYAHRSSIIHRDLKPGNILVTKEGTPYVVDFGLALDLDLERLSAHGVRLGTFAYMPPEWIAEDEGRTDLLDG